MVQLPPVVDWEETVVVATVIEEVVEVMVEVRLEVVEVVELTEEVDVDRVEDPSLVVAVNS